MNQSHPQQLNVSRGGMFLEWTQRSPLTVIFLLALVLRLAFFGVFGVIENNDSIDYKELANNVLAGNGFSEDLAPPFEPYLFRLPGYPLFLSAHYLLGQNGDIFVVLTQSLLGSLTCVLVFLLARHFLPPAGALLAGVLAACHVIQIYLASSILAEVLFTFLVAICFLLSVRPTNWGRPGPCLAMGTLVGLATLIRPPGAFLVPVCALAILLAPLAISRLKRWAMLLCFLLPVILATQVWCIRNYRVAGYYGLTALKGYYLLYKAMRFTEIRPENFTGEERLAAEVAGNNLRVIAVGEVLHDQYGYSRAKINVLYGRIALATIAKKPLRYFGHSVFDFLNSFVSPSLSTRILSFPPIGWKNAHRRFQENLREGNYTAIALNVMLRLFFGAIFFVVMPVGGYLLWLHQRETRPEQLLLWGYALTTIGASALLAGGSDRFRAPMDPIFLVFISAGICQFLKGKTEKAEGKKARPGSRAFFDENIDRIERFSRLNHYYHDEIARLWRFYLTPGDQVLEVGCGTGDLLAALDPTKGVGVDFSGQAIGRALRKYPGLRIAQAEAQNFTLRERFDIVVMSDLVGYLDDVQSAFQNLHHCMNSHSRLMISFFNHLWEPGLKLAEFLGLKAPAGIQNWLSLGDVANLLRLAGFEIITSGYRFLFPYKVPLIAAFVNRFIAKLPIIRKFCLVQYVVARPASVCPPDWQTRYSCSIVIPTRNEVGNVAGIFERTPFMGKATELVFVDGNSTDGTLEEIERRMAEYQGPMTMRLIHQGAARGKADAVRKGFEAATGDILMILDSDLTMPPEELPKYYRAIATGQAELVNGCRLVYPMEQQAMRLINYVGNKFFGMAFSWLLGQPIRDTLCGTKVLSRRDYEKIKAGREFFGDFDPFGDFDLLFGAARTARKIIDLPIRYRDRTFGETKINRWRHGWLLIQMCGIAFLRFKIN
jgi:SAM-dependent methyltransferase/4-amino-4-deoxy-L-arabinose transferase-like glycosyltransferase